MGDRAVAVERAPSIDEPMIVSKSQFPSLPGDRLLTRPVFIMSSVRSGSTMLRVMLNSHSKICAPHELHLTSVQVNVRGGAVRGMHAIGLDRIQLEHLLWDRIMHRELTREGKHILVNKTPTSVFHWRRLLECWPDARFIYLLRHPAATAQSWTRAKPDWPAERVERDVLRYMIAIEEIRAECEGLTVRYEDITTHPQEELQRICDFLEVQPEPEMINYGSGKPVTFERILGDWSERIQSGRVQPPRDLPRADEIPASLIDMCRKWGYLPAEHSADAGATL